MALKRVTISLDEDEVMKLNQIIVDRESEEALDFLEECVQKKILLQESTPCEGPKDDFLRRGH